MSGILISGLVNTETTVPVRRFPVEYYPIDYPFFGVNTAASGVAYNIAAALGTLGDPVTLLSMTGDDFAGRYIREELADRGIGTDGLRPQLRQTPASVVLYDPQGKRQVYCDLKDIQEAVYDFSGVPLEAATLVVACNTNFNRPLLRRARELGKTVATDVHVLRDIHDEYNRDFMAGADILFLSDEGIGEDYEDFLRELARTYGNRIVVLGRGPKGAALYQQAKDSVTEMPAVELGPVVNTVGAGDALFSGFLHYYVRGMAPEECLWRAQIFAAAKIRESGAAKGLITEEVLERYAEELRRNG